MVLYLSISLNELCDCTKELLPSSSSSRSYTSHRRELACLNRLLSYPYYLESRQADQLFRHKTISTTSNSPFSTAIGELRIAPSLKSTDDSQIYPSIVVKDPKSTLPSNNLFTTSNSKESFSSAIVHSNSANFKSLKNLQCSPVKREKSLLSCDITNQAQSAENSNRLNNADVISDQDKNLLFSNHKDQAVQESFSLNNNFWKAEHEHLKSDCTESSGNAETIASSNTWSTYSSILDALESLCTTPIFETSSIDVKAYNDLLMQHEDKNQSQITASHRQESRDAYVSEIYHGFPRGKTTTAIFKKSGYTHELATYNFITIYELCTGRTAFPVSALTNSQSVPISVVESLPKFVKGSKHGNSESFSNSTEISSHLLSFEMNNNSPRKAGRLVLRTITNIAPAESSASKLNTSPLSPHISKSAPQITIDCVDDEIKLLGAGAYLSSSNAEPFSYPDLGLLSISWCPKMTLVGNELPKSDYLISMFVKDLGPNLNPWFLRLSSLMSLADLESQLEHDLLYPVEIRTKSSKGRKLIFRSVRTEEEFDKWIRRWGQKCSVVEVEVVRRQHMVTGLSVWKRLVSWAY